VRDNKKRLQSKPVAFFYENKQSDRFRVTDYVGQLEEKLGRVLRPQKGGKPKK